MQDTIDTMFVDEKIIRMYSFCAFSPWNTRQMNFKICIVTKTSHTPPLSLPTVPSPLFVLVLLVEFSAWSIFNYSPNSLSSLLSSYSLFISDRVNTLITWQCCPGYFTHSYSRRLPALGLLGPKLRFTIGPAQLRISKPS